MQNGSVPPVEHSPPPIKVPQNNTGKSHTAFLALLQTLAETQANTLPTQEPPLNKSLHPNIDDFHSFPKCELKPRCITYVRKNAFKSTSAISKPHKDFIVCHLTLHSTEYKAPTISVANIYNALEDRNLRDRGAPTHSLDHLFHEIFSLTDIVAGDMNKHNPAWNPTKPMSIWEQNLVDIYKAAGFCLSNTKGRITCIPTNGNAPSIIDLTLLNRATADIEGWKTLPDQRTVDHIPITFFVQPALKNSTRFKGYNWNKTS